MRGRRETELPPFIETGVLRVDVKTEGPRIAQGGLQGGFASQDKGKPRHSFDALVGRRHEEVDVLKMNKKDIADRSAYFEQAFNDSSFTSFVTNNTSTAPWPERPHLDTPLDGDGGEVL